MASMANLEEELRARTVDLVQQFDDEVDVMTSDSSPASEQLPSLDGLAGNTVRLLRDNKTNTVRADRSDPGTFDVDGIKDAIDSAIQHVFDTKAEWHLAQRAEVVEQQPVQSEEEIDLSDVSEHSEDISAELAALATLRKSGVLSKKEFRNAKARLIRR